MALAQQADQAVPLGLPSTRLNLACPRLLFFEECGASFGILQVGNSVIQKDEKLVMFGVLLLFLPNECCFGIGNELP